MFRLYFFLCQTVIGTVGYAVSDDNSAPAYWVS